MRNAAFTRLLGIAIRHAREDKGLTREELAFESHVDRTTIERIEYGKQDLKGSTLFDISYVLDIDLNALFKQIREELEQ